MPTSLRAGFPILIIALLQPIFGASSKERNIIFEVGEIQISHHLYERQKARSIKRAQRPRSTTEPLFNETEWRKKWIEKLLFVCEARELGYADHKDVIEAAEALSDHMLLNSADGPYARHLFRNTEFSKLEGPERSRAIRNLFSKEKLEILSQTNPTVESKTSTLLISYISSLSKKDKPLAIPQTELKDMGLFSYANNGKTVAVSVSDFLNRHNRTVIGRSLDSKKNLRIEIENVIVGNIRRENAQRLGLDQNWKFLQNRSNFINNTTYNVYENEHLRKSLVIDKAGIDDYYTRNHESFAKPVLIEIISIRGKDRNAIMSQRSKIRREISTQAIDEIAQTSFDIYMNIKKERLRVNEANYARIRSSRLFETEVGQFTPVNPTDSGEFETLLKLSSSGRSIPELELVADEVKERYAEELLAKKKASKLQELREKYKYLEHFSASNDESTR